MNFDWTHWSGWIAAATLFGGWLWRHTSTVRRMALFEGRTMEGMTTIAAEVKAMGEEMRAGFDKVHERIDNHLEHSITRKRRRK